MSNGKKTALFIAGVGDILLSEQSPRKLKTASQLREKVEATIELAMKEKEFVGLVDFHYSSDTKKDVNVFKKYPKTRTIDLKLNSRDIFNDVNELTIYAHEGDKIMLPGTQLTYIFRPEEYEIVFLGVDLHGIYVPAIEELLEKGYTVKVVKDALSMFPNNMKLVTALQEKYRSTFNFVFSDRL